MGLERSLLLDWYLGSQKLREILTLLYCITLSSPRENQRNAQEVARRISGAVAGEAHTKSSQDLISRQRAISGAVSGESTHKSRHTKYPSQLLSLALHYLPFAFRFPLPHFTLVVLFALSLHSPSLFQFASFACFVIMASPLSTPYLSRMRSLILNKGREKI